MDDEIIAGLIKSNDEWFRLNDAYRTSPQTRKDRARLFADHKRWRAARDKMLKEWRATRQPTATE